MLIYSALFRLSLVGAGAGDGIPVDLLQVLFKEQKSRTF
jgi:hypothetical protein